LVGLEEVEPRPEGKPREVQYVAELSFGSRGARRELAESRNRRVKFGPTGPVLGHHSKQWDQNLATVWNAVEVWEGG